MISTPKIVNFGQNVRFTPRRLYAPRTEPDLLDILNAHKNGQIRVVGSRHSWSQAIVSDDALIDMRHFNKIRIHQQGGQTWATVGGGVQIKHLLATLNRHGLTTPTVGLITEQTIAGAISTSTHGSGKSSLSHYVRSVRLACFSEDGGSAQIRDVSDGTELRAARCALGCLGVIVDVTIPCIPQYYVRERVAPCDSIEEVLAREKQTPLQQFYLVPHLWRYYVHERAVAHENKPSPSAPLYRLHWLVNIDVGLHLLIKLFAAVFKSQRLIRLLYRHVVPAMIFPRWVVTDRSDRMLIMEHELFRHLELELFVPARHVAAAADYVTQVLQVTGGSRAGLSADAEEQLETIGLREALDDLHGTFQHHYVVCFRRVLADDTLISMTSGSEDCWYSLSFITYAHPREPFYHMARFLAKSMTQLFGARLHWGKWFPLGADDVRRSYPALPEFQDVCRRFDPRGVFRNKYVTSVLGLPATKAVEKESQHVAI
jgi:FAD/FMN-containing dehydrogenase